MEKVARSIELQNQNPDMERLDSLAVEHNVGQIYK